MSSGSSSHSLVIPPTPSTHFPGVSWSRTRTHTDAFSHPHFTPSPHATTRGGGGWRPNLAASGTQGANKSRRGSGDQHGQSTVALEFEIIAGVAGVLILAFLGHCVYIYRRAPARDLRRDGLQYEMAELGRRPTVHEHDRWRPPPPPYQSAPEYDTVVQHAVDGEGSIDWGSPPRFSLERDRSRFVGVEREDEDGEIVAARLTQPSPMHSP